MFRLQATSKALAFRVTGVEALPAVIATDEKRLRQILINLLSNAIKFTRAGHIALNVSYRNQIATISVADSGSGIATEDLDRIFQPFDRGALTGSEAIPGLGLGLTITKLLCNLMGGDISVDSTPGVGSTFRVKMMLAAVAAPSLKAARNVHGYTGRRRTILVVDDDQDHQALMRATLEPLGFSVLNARDGATCLALVGDLRPDIFLLDISMPGISGWDLARQLRDLKGVTAPIVMLSANIGDSFPVPGHDDAHSATLSKPLDLSRLFDTLGAQLGIDWIAVAARPDPVLVRAGLLEARLAESDFKELRELGAIGYVRGIEAKLDAIAEAPSLTGLADTLRDRIRQFDFEGFAAALEAARHAGVES